MNETAPSFHIDRIPLALYVHMPWCVKKCPYCDFNSHGLRDTTPDYAQYIDALIADLDGDLADFGDAVSGREIVSIFFGGGTPSLFPPEQIARLLRAVRERLQLDDAIEITLETNPGTVEHGRFEDYLAAGVNRLSFGVQSFNDVILQRLGRIHSAHEAETAIGLAREAGYDNVNIDLMYALPKQTLDGALHDIERALALQPTHISHYQLTLEPNTAFAANPPPLPDDDSAWDMQEACQERLAQAGYTQYEISAYAQPGRQCAHNLNYWRFGDYLGIGAGAHAKITQKDGVHRRWKTRHPRGYLAASEHAQRIGGDKVVPEGELDFEYMLNALRLIQGTELAQFTQRTGRDITQIRCALDKARANAWLHASDTRLETTATGQRFLNDVIALFM